MYIDGIILPVPEGNEAAYKEMAARIDPMFIEHGALQVVEGWGDDIARGEHTDFFKAVAAEEGENVVFSWILWPSKEARDAGWAKIMEDDRMNNPGEMPFDGKRMFWGGFDGFLDIKSA
ncbi:DUF1428 domain-containing protein [Stakelama tenebrarum]|uniref:DUF1428 domain-containing protein n=1 Tax=Stakelama tenebrarum TaxID=2711215 RepID=A0A6G6Y2P5_9SPHN|nr:DUF1428 domain-containing protein [Sphingosinithalassobacter tenebrarum]QIG79195.1 DUF1428 domain-containing protein [Sphingosinithalassobacter tenebrarum]